jgi:hypothetical protein
LSIQPNTVTAAGGTIVTNANGTVANLTSVGTITALSDGAVGALTLVLTASACTVSVDGTTTSTISAKATDTQGTTITNLLVSISASRGTLSATSNTTTSTALTTGSTGTGTITFRGNGTTGEANITAPNPSIATTVSNCPDPDGGGPLLAGVIRVLSNASTPSKFNLRDTTNSGNIGADVTTEYVSTNKESRVRFQVADGNNNGVNLQLVQATVDKGYVDTLTGCPSSNTSSSMTSASTVIDTATVDGVVTFFVCARPGQNGAVKLTVKNLSTTHADGTATLTAAGTPNKITATVTGNTVSVTVTDKDGNNVAENTPVFFQVPSFTGTVAPACALTAGGKASGSAAFSGSGGQVLVTASHNSSGGVPGCPGGGNTVSAAGILGTVPTAGRFGLIGVASATTVDALIAAATTAGCNVTSLSITSAAAASGWLVHIKGAPAAVNTSFAGTAAVPAGGAGLLCG